MPNLIINEELKNLLPPLSDAEFKGLEEQILKEGCRDRLIVWDGILIDGHHRYAICTKHNLDFDVTEFTFSDINEAKLWIWKHQDNRRNLTDFRLLRYVLLDLKAGIVRRRPQNEAAASYEPPIQTTTPTQPTSSDR